MSTRPFWIIFTILIIVLVEWLIVKPVAEWRIVDEIIATSHPYAEVFLTDDPKDQTRPIVKSDFDSKTLQFKWNSLYTLSQQRAVLIAVALFVMGILIGFLLSSMAFRQIVRISERMKRLSVTDKIAGLIGILLGVMISLMLVPGVMSLFRLGRDPVAIMVAGVVIIYLCVAAMMSMKDEMKFSYPGMANAEQEKRPIQKPKLLDTNVIIDGRVADICRAGFIEGQVHVPSFVLEELQHIADSADSLRRARGRRGLDILNAMRKEMDLTVTQATAVDPADSDEVDARLVKLAKELDGCIVTNDFNLNKVAELQGVPVLNINELANALKPVVLPGEEFSASIIKEGKEASQGVAYLDDGTMVVVEGGRTRIGETVDVVVTSVLQTVAGKMIFANLKAEQDQEDDLIDRNVRNYSGFRPRKKT